MTQPSTGADARLNELESRLALQDHSILELGSEVYEQQKQIARLEAAIHRLTDRLEQVEHAPSAAGSAAEVPPHY